MKIFLLFNNALIFALLINNTVSKAQTLQFLNNQALTNNIVSADKNAFYTYTNISTNGFPAPANFEIKKFDATTNTYTPVYSYPNPGKYVNFHPRAVIGNKFIIGADYTTANAFNLKSHYYVYDGVTYDSLFTKTDSIFGSYIGYTDVVNQKHYFVVPGKPSIYGIYKTDFTKIGTTKFYTPTGSIGDFMGINNLLFFKETKIVGFFPKSIIYKYDGTTLSMIDSGATINMRKNEITNEIYIQNQATFFTINVDIKKIDVLGNLTTLNNTGTFKPFLGALNNKLIFGSASPGAGLNVYDLTSNTSSTIYLSGSTTAPVFGNNNTTNDVKISTSGNTLYFMLTDNSGNRKIYSTNGSTVSLTDTTAFTIPLYTSLGDAFCGESMLTQDLITFNNIELVAIPPSGAAGSGCPNPPAQTVCLTTSVLNANSKAYVFALQNLYEITNCAAVLGLEDLSNNKMQLYPNPATDVLTINSEENGAAIIYNALGKAVINISIIDNTIVDISSLSKGIYIVKTNTGKVSKFVKE